MTNPEQQSPADIAREAFRRLAARRIAPTPEAYREVYDEVAGHREHSPAEKILADLAASLAKGPRDLTLFAQRFSDSVKERDWEGYGRQLNQLVTKHLMQPPAAEKADAELQPGKSATKTGSIPLVDDIEPVPPKRPSIPLVDEIAPPHETTRSISLVDEVPPEHAEAEQIPGAAAPRFNDTQVTRMLREMLVRSLTLAIPALLQDARELTQESEALASEISSARARQATAEIEARFKQFCFRVEMKGEDMAEEHELLLRLFKLVIENIGELLEDDAWLAGQLANVKEILSGPVNYASLLDATRSLKEVIYKQSLLKHSLREAKARMKDLILTVIDRLGTAAASTGDYQNKLDNYSQQISLAQGAGDLSQIVDKLLHDTRIAHIEAVRRHDDVMAVRQEVEVSATRVQELESQLAEMSKLAYEDQLTGSLNRRGLDEVLEREMARSERKKTPLCVALLDLDNFKKLNDTHGHSAGDGALIHLVKVVKETLREMDIIGRYGGEEFLLVLPDTALADAVQVVTRVQRELTKRIFMHDNQRLLITFSSGVALRKDREDQAALFARADEALYKAKKAGKNRVISAE
ncbi:MAG TPA: GGDEF domain-containing protein [Noviherbaspirillum sp.]